MFLTSMAPVLLSDLQYSPCWSQHCTVSMQIKVLFLVGFLCTLATGEKFLYEKDRAGGLLGLGLLGGDSSGASDATTAGTVEATTAAADGLDGPMKALLDLLTGVTTILPISDIASLMGINTDPIPSPFSDPLGFVMHPLVTPIIMAAITFNIPALALAQGALAGNLIITHLLTMQAQG